MLTQRAMQFHCKVVKAQTITLPPSTDHLHRFLHSLYGMALASYSSTMPSFFALFFSFFKGSKYAFILAL